MAVDLRIVAACAALAVAVAGTLATPAFFPQAFANEPQHQLVRRAKDIFPPPFDPSRLRKFDITVADTVSTEPTRTQLVNKIEFGRKSVVEIVTTPTGTYSTDALTSPNVRYPGIDVTPHCTCHDFAFSLWTSPYGTSTWSSYNSGSFTFFTQSFKSTRPLHR